MHYWDPRIEEMPRDELRKMQYRLLKTLVYRLYSFSPFYHERMREWKVHPDDIGSLEDIRKLPFMYKRDLRDNYPDRIFTASQDDLVRYHVSSGTTGKPTVVGYTQADLNNWTTSLARGLTSCGLGRGDVIQVSYGYGLFTGGLGLHYGAERIRGHRAPHQRGEHRAADRADAGPARHRDRMHPVVFAPHGRGGGEDGSLHQERYSVRAGILGAEPWSATMKDRIEEWLGIRAYDIYGTSELSGPMFCECTAQKGFHVWSDLAYVEVLDPGTGEPLPSGEKGELVITMLQKEALPMIRYKIGDISSIEDEVCPCGRTHPRVQRISGRVDDMLIIRGINVFPSQIEHALMNIPQVGEHFQIVVDRKGALDDMLVRVEVSPEAFSDKITDLMKIGKLVEHRLRNSLNVAVHVELVEPGSLPRFEGKAKRVIDRRSL